MLSDCYGHKTDINILLFSKKFKNKPCFFIKHSVYYQRCSAESTYNCIWRGILMVRSHIGNVVCRKALCVRVASSPPERVRIQIVFGLFVFNLIIMLKWEIFIRYSNENKLHLFLFSFSGNQQVTVRYLIFYSWLFQKYLLVTLLCWLKWFLIFER